MKLSHTACLISLPTLLPAIVCTQPADITGYTVNGGNLDLGTGTGFTVTASCASGYWGTPGTAACTTSGPYTLSGCTGAVA